MKAVADINFDDCRRDTLVNLFDLPVERIARTKDARKNNRYVFLVRGLIV